MQDENEQDKVEFEEDKSLSFIKRRTENRKISTSAKILLNLKIIKREEQANFVLLAFSTVLLILTLYFSSNNYASQPKTIPAKDLSYETISKLPPSIQNKIIQEKIKAFNEENSTQKQR